MVDRDPPLAPVPPEPATHALPIPPDPLVPPAPPEPFESDVESWDEGVSI